MAQVAQPPNPLVAHRVYHLGAMAHDHESEDADAAHAHAARVSKEHPLMRIEVRGVPKLIPNVKGGSPGSPAPALIPNEGHRYERVVAVYQGGKQIPIT